MPSHFKDIFYSEGKKKKTFFSYVNVEVEAILALKNQYKKIFLDFLRSSNFFLPLECRILKKSSSVEPVWFKNSNRPYAL